MKPALEAVRFFEDKLTNTVLVVGDTTLKMTRKPMELQKEIAAGCTGEGTQSK